MSFGDLSVLPFDVICLIIHCCPLTSLLRFKLICRDFLLALSSSMYWAGRVRHEQLSLSLYNEVLTHFPLTPYERYLRALAQVDIYFGTKRFIGLGLHESRAFARKNLEILGCVVTDDYRQLVEVLIAEDYMLAETLMMSRISGHDFIDLLKSLIRDVPIIPPDLHIRLKFQLYKLQSRCGGELFSALELDDVPQVRKLLNDISNQDVSGVVAIYGVINSRYELLKLAFSYGLHPIDVELIFCFAVYQGDKQLLEMLSLWNAKRLLQTRSRLYFYAACSQHLDLLEGFSKRSYPVLVHNSILYGAIRGGHFELLRRLPSEKISNPKLLELAIQFDQYKIFTFLLGYIEPREINFDELIEIAITYGRLTFLDMIIDRRTKIDSHLFWAIREHKEDVVKYFLKLKLDEELIGKITSELIESGNLRLFHLFVQQRPLKDPGAFMNVAVNSDQRKIFLYLLDLIKDRLDLTGALVRLHSNTPSSYKDLILERFIQ